MAWYPGATHWPLNCETTDRSHTPVRMTLHTAVSGATNLYKYGPYKGTYSTFYVNGIGDVYQYASTSQATRASGAGNYGDISVETWDGASERALTSSQVTALGQLLAWIWDTHPSVPRRIAAPGDLRGSPAPARLRRRLRSFRPERQENLVQGADRRPLVHRLREKLSLRRQDRPGGRHLRSRDRRLHRTRAYTTT